MEPNSETQEEPGGFPISRVGAGGGMGLSNHGGAQPPRGTDSAFYFPASSCGFYIAPSFLVLMLPSALLMWPL